MSEHEDQICSNCGTQSPWEEHFCPVCGWELASGVQDESNPEAPTGTFGIFQSHASARLSIVAVLALIVIIAGAFAVSAYRRKPYTGTYASKEYGLDLGDHSFACEVETSNQRYAIRGTYKDVGGLLHLYANENGVAKEVALLEPKGETAIFTFGHSEPVVLQYQKGHPFGAD